MCEVCASTILVPYYLYPLHNCEACGGGNEIERTLNESSKFHLYIACAQYLVIMFSLNIAHFKLYRHFFGSRRS